MNDYSYRPLSGLRGRKDTVSTRPAGSDLLRSAIASAVAISEGNPGMAVRYAAKRWGEQSVPVAIIEKADVAAGSTLSSGTWGSPLLSQDGASSAAFFGMVDSQSVLGRAKFRQVPALTPIIRGAGVSATWVQEGYGKPLSSVAYQRLPGLPLTKLVTMVVLTDEQIRDTRPSAEAVIMEEMVRSLTVTLDDSLVNPSNAGTLSDGGVVIEPASIFFGATQAGGGSPTVDADENLESLLDSFTGNLETSFLVMRPTMAARLTGAARPMIGAKGGSWAGIDVLTSSNVPDQFIGLADRTGIAVTTDDANSGFRVSRQGSIQMKDGVEVTQTSTGEPAEFDSPPPDPTAVGSTLTSLWQTGAVGIVCERYINWRVIRPGAAVYITGVSY
jgi:hypothetical protein